MYIYRILLASNGYKVPPIYQTFNWFIIFCLKYYYTRQVVIYVYDKSFHLTSKLCITLLQTRLWRTRCNSLVIRHSRLPSENKAFNMFGSVCGSRRLLLRFCISIRVASPFFKQLPFWPVLKYQEMRYQLYDHLFTI